MPSALMDARVRGHDRAVGFHCQGGIATRRVWQTTVTPDSIGGPCLRPSPRLHRDTSIQPSLRLHRSSCLRHSWMPACAGMTGQRGLAGGLVWPS